jgi:hypothetical protein
MNEILIPLSMMIWLALMVGAVLKIYPAVRHLKTIAEATVRQNELLVALLAGAPAPPPAPVAGARKMGFGQKVLVVALIVLAVYAVSSTTIGIFAGVSNLISSSSAVAPTVLGTAATEKKPETCRNPHETLGPSGVCWCDAGYRQDPANLRCVKE